MRGPLAQRLLFAGMPVHVSRRRQRDAAGPDGDWRTLLGPEHWSSTLDASTPVKRLLLAVLEDAVDAFQKNLFAVSRQGRHLFLEAEGWFATDSEDHPLAFVTICHALGIDVSYLRAGLRRWRERAEQARASAAQGQHPSAA